MSHRTSRKKQENVLRLDFLRNQSFCHSLHQRPLSMMRHLFSLINFLESSTTHLRWDIFMRIKDRSFILSEFSVANAVENWHFAFGTLSCHYFRFVFVFVSFSAGFSDKFALTIYRATFSSRWLYYVLYFSVTSRTVGLHFFVYINCTYTHTTAKLKVHCPSASVGEDTLIRLFPATENIVQS